jgi:hypothetical protein
VPNPVDKAANDQQGIRVSVQRSVSNAAVFVVRRLESGQPLPPGTSEARLVFAAPSGDSSEEMRKA